MPIANCRLPIADCPLPIVNYQLKDLTSLEPGYQWAMGNGQSAIGSWQSAIGSWQSAIGNVLAERVGFEPTVRFPVHSISSAANSTTLAPLLNIANFHLPIANCAI